MTEVQVAVQLGLAAFPQESPQRQEILKQAQQYVSKAVVVGGRFVQENAWVGATQALVPIMFLEGLHISAHIWKTLKGFVGLCRDLGFP